MNFDKYYDSVSAARVLEELAKKKIDVIQRRGDPSTQHLSEVDLDNVVVQETGLHRKTWRLSVPGDGTIEDHEVLFRVHGVLSKVELVPGNISKMSASRMANLSQRVQIVGLGGGSFDRAIQNTKVIQEHYGRFFGSRRINPWNVGQAGGATYINASCRYFNSEKDDPTATVIEFGPGVDPLNLFAKANVKGEGLIHTLDNEVKYFKSANDPASGELFYYSAFPGVFRVGDIVEVQGTVVAFVNRQNIVKTHFHLVSLTLQDSKFAKDAEIARSKVSVPKGPGVTLRRKACFEEEEDSAVSHTRRKFKEMRFDDSSEA
ncbi:hypothetical protein C8F04DRAFT_1261057 [Mycena alexandri]|uniref:Uncharacterized protein n=1 Tax=Mycena alexandri TaxID=1745969 RepID=A0AAD6X396_9AGAR|nr:hypothetical protein C8F04DRAFT_1261057 [Mycena alexandri]